MDQSGQSRMKKILLITTRNLHNIGGVERYLNNFIKHYHRPDTKLVLLLKYPYEVSKDNGTANIEIKYFDSAFGPYKNFLRFLNPLRSLWANRRNIGPHIKEIRPDIIVTRDWDMVLAAAGVLKSVPIYFIPGSLIKMDLMFDRSHDVGGLYALSRRIQNVIKTWLEGLALRRATHIFVFSKNFQKRIEQHYRIPAKKIRVVRMGIELPLTAAVSQEKGMILCAGRLAKSKNFHTAIAAMQGLDGFRLFIAGDGPQRKEIEELIQKLKLEDRVVLLGKQDDLRDYYQRCEIFLHLSYYENLGQVLLEAMSYGKPPVVLDPSGLGVHTASEELIEDGYNGFFVANDPVQIRAKIIEIAQLPKNVLSANCKNFVRDFTFSRHCEEFAGFIEKGKS